MAITNEASDFAKVAAGNVNAKSVEPQVQQPVQSQQQPQYNTGYTGEANQGFNAFAQPTSYVPHSELGAGLLNQGMEYDVPYNQTSGKVQAYLVELEKSAKNYPNLMMARDNWDFIVFDGVSNQSAISGVLFVRRVGTIAAVYAYLVQDSLEPLQDKTITTSYGGYNNVSISVPQLAEELLTSENDLVLNIKRYVLATYAGKGIKEVFYVGGLVLPPELNPTNTAQLDRVIFYGNSALETTLFKLAGNPRRFTIAKKADDEQLVVKLDFDAGKAATSVGLPVRSDLAIKLHVAGKTNNKNNSLSARVSRAFSTVRGHMMLQYVGLSHNPMMQMNMTPWGQPQYPGVFQPIFVINSLDNQFSAATLETQLLALSTATAITRDNAWVNCFKPNMQIRGNPGDDPRDIGMITADVAYPGEQKGYTPLKDGKIDFYQFISKWLIPSTLFMVDIPELGDLTYIQRVFLEASGATNNSQITARANQAIVEAANYLTNGRFSAHWQGNEPIVLNQVGRIETGFFYNEKDEMCDLADIDYLYLLNRFGPELAQRFTDTLNPNGPSEIVRSANRIRIYQENFQGCQIRGYARRLTINSKFLVALAQALQEVGGVYNVESYFYSGQNIERGYQNSILGIGMNGVNNFVQGFGMGNTQGNHAWRVYQTVAQPVYSY